MIVIEKNEGTKIVYEVEGTIINFDDELMLNLAKYERDYEVNIDICRNMQGVLTTAADPRGGAYVAQITIPEKEYEYIEGEPDDEGRPTTKKVALMFDIEKVVLTLWAK